MQNILIVDDEPLARVRIAQLVADIAATSGLAVKVAGEADHAQAALDWLSSHSADVVLLDIHMPGLQGTGLAQRINAMPVPPAIVFVTAHAEHALEAFELAAVDYLTKPVRRERLQAALERCAKRAPAGHGAEVPVIIVSERGKVVRVPLSEVLYLKAELKYVTLRTAARSYVLEESLTELEPRLGDAFLRVHRNAIVAKAAVRALERREADPADGEGAEGWAVCVRPVDEWLAVSRRQLTAVREALAASGL
ncbi:LytR/AlgR family response regulator transcription factor [Caldimonas sp. KR1-144]|uniref:LytR/AlgR family response regulator transcription factor n=1 Tax=Caldimonas sp. KR1-144 TaxID=3400911 RepID=UPI003C0DDB84